MALGVDWRVTLMNRNAVALVADGRDLRGQQLWQAYPEAVGGGFWRACQRCMAERVPTEAEEHSTRLGRTFTVRAFPAEDGGVTLFLQDVTQRRRTEAALARSSEEARIAAERVQLALAAGAIIGTWLWELPTDTLTVDERFTESFGIDPALGRTGLSLEQVVATVHPEDLPGLRAAIAEALARGGPYSHEYRVRGRDGVLRWIEANGRVDLAADGTPLRFPGVLLDIGRRRALEAERDRATALLRAFADAVPGVVYAKDRQGRMLVANRGVTELIGKPPEFYLGRTDLEFLDDPAQAAAVMANDRRIMDSGQAEQVEETVSRPGGASVVFLSTKAPFRDARGRVIGIIGASVDISARKAAEAALAGLNATLEQQVRQRTAQLQAILDSAGSAIVVTDTQHRITLFNRAAETLTGHVQAQALGRPATALLFDPPGPPMGRQAAEAAGFGHGPGLGHATAALPAARPHGGEWALPRRDGGRVPVLLEARTLYGEDACSLGMVYAITDISERKRFEAVLLQSQQDLSRLTQRLMEQEQATTQRLAQLLHDGLGQTLSALRLQLDALDATDPLQQLPARLRRPVETVRKLTAQANAEVRGALVELRPALLEDEGLLPALTNRLSWCRRDAPDVELQLLVAPGLQARRWPREVEYAFFMVAREALANALLHAGARRIQCVLEGDRTWLRLQVRDDGRGLADDPQRPGHLGVVGMRERAFAIGARFELRGRPGQGARMEMEWEADADADAEPDAPLPGA